jgi:hypothetical protein
VVYNIAGNDYLQIMIQMLIAYTELIFLYTQNFVVEEFQQLCIMQKKEFSYGAKFKENIAEGRLYNYYKYANIMSAQGYAEK